MYKLKQEVEDVFDARFRQKSFFHKTRGSHYKLVERDYENLSIVWESQCYNVSDYEINSSYLIFDSDDINSTVILTLESKVEILNLKFKFSFDDRLINSKYLVGNSQKKGINILDIQSKSFFTIPKEDFSAYLLVDSNVICINKSKDLIASRDIISGNLFLKWQYSTLLLGTYKEKKIFAHKEPEEKQREIKRIYYHQDKIIVSLSSAIIALNPETGELLWQVDFNEYTPVDLVFDGNIAYVGVRLYYAVIDIDKGEMIFESEFDQDIEIEGNKISWVNSGSGLVLHQDYLWCVFNENGYCYLVKLNPESGKFIEGMKLATQAPSTKPPVFDDNRIYILDQNGILFIYEEQTT